MSHSELENVVKAQLYEHTGKALNNFDVTLPRPQNALTAQGKESCMKNGTTMEDCFRIERIGKFTDALKEELVKVWEESVRNSYHFLSEEDLHYYRARIKNIYFQTVELYVIRKQHVVAFMGLSDDMVEMLFVLPTEKGKGYGTALLNYALEERHIRKIDVNEQNDEAYSFYLRRGYKAIGRDEKDGDGKSYPIIHLERYN